MNVAPGLRDKNLARIDDHQLVAVDYFAVFIHRADAVGIAVEGDSEIGAGLAHFGDEGFEIVGNGRIGMVIGEAAVHVEDTFRWRRR